MRRDSTLTHITAERRTFQNVNRETKPKLKSDRGLCNNFNVAHMKKNKIKWKTKKSRTKAKRGTRLNWMMIAVLCVVSMTRSRVCCINILQVQQFSALFLTWKTIKMIRNNNTAIRRMDPKRHQKPESDERGIFEFATHRMLLLLWALFLFPFVRRKASEKTNWTVKWMKQNFFCRSRNFYFTKLTAIETLLFFLLSD